MITRREIRALAEFQSAKGCAVTFYYQPDTPPNQSHRDEAILVKDLGREALREAEKEGRNDYARADLSRILELAERLHGNAGKAKAVFADASQNFWREFDIPAWLDKTRVVINRRFHLRPLAPLLEANPQVCVCVVDRSKARLFDYQNEICKEVIGFFNEPPRVGESTGGGGYDAGHISRRASEFAKQHYKQVADTILKFFERGSCESLAVGIRDENWAEFEPVLHPYLKKNLVGRFHVDPASATPQQLKVNLERLLGEHELNRHRGLVREVLGEAQRKARGAVGLRRVLRSLESGEIQTLLLGEHFQALGVECRNCGHVDMKVQPNCAICAHPVSEVEDISDAILGAALRGGIEVVYVRDDRELEAAGHIAALLRFRADQKKAVAS
jgi:peptide subunit release factor 1 (eRF1)